MQISIPAKRLDPSWPKLSYDSLHLDRKKRLLRVNGADQRHPMLQYHDSEEHLTLHIKEH